MGIALLDNDNDLSSQFNDECYHHTVLVPSPDIGHTITHN